MNWTIKLVMARGNPTSPELNHLSAKLGVLFPFRKVACILEEFFPVSEAVNAGTIRNRTARVTRVLEDYGDEPSEAAAGPAPKELVVGMDGGYVRNRHRTAASRPDRGEDQFLIS